MNKQQQKYQNCVSQQEMAYLTEKQPNKGVSEQSEMTELCKTSSSSIRKFPIRNLSIAIYYFPKPQRKVVAIVSSELTVESAIDIAVKRISDQYILDMDPNTKMYDLFATKKGGNRDLDMPQIDRHQKLKWTGLSSFCLQEKERRQSCYIQIDLQKKYALNLKKIRKVSNEVKCFCISC